MGKLEQSIRETAGNLSSSKYIAAKLDTWGLATKRDYILAYKESDWNRIYFLTSDLIGSAYSRQKKLAGLYDVLKEQQEEQSLPPP